MPTYRGARLLAMVAMLPPMTPAAAQEQAPQVNAKEYEGWRQYSVHCARCHGQDVTGNPVAANLLESARSGGPVAAEEAFTQVVHEGRTAKGMSGVQDHLEAGADRCDLRLREGPGGRAHSGGPAAGTGSVRRR